MKFKNEKKKLAIFDVDGTIFRKNFQFELLDRLTYAGVFKKETRNKIVGQYRKWLNNKGTYETYRKKLVNLYKKGIKGIPKRKVIQAAKEVASFNRDRVYVFSKKLIEKLRKDHLMIVISGSPMEVISQFNNYLKFDAVFGTIYEISKEGSYTGREIFSPARDKAEVIQKYLRENRISLKGSVGVGDTESDIPMLEIVAKPIAFNPNSNLYGYARRREWDVVVERKDVIYNIK